MHKSQLSEERGTITVEGMAIKGRNLLLFLCVCCCSLDVQQQEMLIPARKDCTIKKSSAQAVSGDTGFLARWLFFFLLFVI